MLYKETVAESTRIQDSFHADAWLSGTTTMKEFATGNPAEPTGHTVTPPRPWHLADKSARYFAIAIDRKGELHWASSQADNGHVVVILGASISDAHLIELQNAGVSYLVFPDDEIDLAALLDELQAKLSIKKLLLEGGATMNGAFLKAGLVDEISLLVCPAIDGKTGSPAIFEAGEAGISRRQNWRLLSATPGPENTCHLRYRAEAT